MPVDTQSSPPSHFTAGDTVIFTAPGDVYPSGTWTMDYVVARNGINLFTVRATTSGTDFLVTVSSATSGVTPGPAAWYLLYTEIATGQRQFADAGVVSIIYNPSGSLTPTANQVLLAGYKNAQLLLASGNKKVDFNGQMFERQDIASLQKIVDRLQAIVWDELRAMGIPQPGGAKLIQNRF